jgi:putative FmdB family regulatory protein
MPIYEYECNQCGKTQEIFQRITEKPLSKCPECSGKLHKLISQSTFHLKGSGWYVTDYAGKGQRTGKKESTSDTKAATADQSVTDTKADGKGSPS